MTVWRTLLEPDARSLRRTRDRAAQLKFRETKQAEAVALVGATVSWRLCLTGAPRAGNAPADHRARHPVGATADRKKRGRAGSCGMRPPR